MFAKSIVFAASEEVSEAAVQASGWFLNNIWLMPLIPAASFLGILFWGKKMRCRGSDPGLVATGATLIFSIAAGIQWLTSVGESGAGAVVREWSWWKSGGIDFKIGTIADGLTIVMVFVVSLVSFLVHIYSTDYVKGDRRYTHFFAFLSLFTASMLFLVMSSSTVQTIVAWELVGVCSFSLISHWWEDKNNSGAGLKAMMTNRVGDMGLLIGMSILFFAAGGTFSIIEINSLAVSGQINHLALLVAACALTAAVMSKSGQFPLHTWLPDAMAGPTPVSALIHAATMVVAGVYLIARLYGVFFEGFSIGSSSINLLALAGGVTTLVGASMAFVQVDIKRVLAYSTISQLGYMVMALGVGAWTAAIFHLFTHAFFKACLFLGSGSVSHGAGGSFNMKTSMGGLRKYMPHTYATFLIASISLAGLPPLAGFWSKDEILGGTGGWGLFGGTGGNGAYTLMLIMGLATAGLTAAYMTRCVYLTFHGEYRGSGHPHESGPRIVRPLWVLAILAVVAGFANLPVGLQLIPDNLTDRFGHYFEPHGVDYFPKIAHATPSWSLAIASGLVVALGIAWAALYYRRVQKRDSSRATERSSGLTQKFRLATAGHSLLVHKYYLDHLYTNVLAHSTRGSVARGIYWFDQKAIDGLVNKVGTTSAKAAQLTYDYVDQKVVDGVVNSTASTSQLVGEELRQMQTGKVQQYAGIMFLAAAIVAVLIIVFT